MEHTGQAKHLETSAIASTALLSSSQSLASSFDRTRPVILVTHGSMNPVHLGHINMMVRAKEELEAQGFTVVKAYMGITRASHI